MCPWRPAGGDKTCGLGHFVMSIPGDVCTPGVQTTAVGDPYWVGGQFKLSDITDASGEGHCRSVAQSSPGSVSALSSLPCVLVGLTWAIISVLATGVEHEAG